MSIKSQPFGINYYYKGFDMEIFIERLKELRKEKNISLQTLAKAIGVSDVAISRWENGLRIPNIISLVALAQFFGVTTDYMLGLED